MYIKYVNYSSILSSNSFSADVVSTAKVIIAPPIELIGKILNRALTRRCSITSSIKITISIVESISLVSTRRSNSSILGSIYS